MNMRTNVQEIITCTDGGSYTFNNDRVCLTMVLATSNPRDLVRHSSLRPIFRDLFAFPSFRKELLNQFLTNMDVPLSFRDGDDCDMITNLSRMLRDSILSRCGVGLDYFCVFVAKIKGICSYSVVNTPWFFHALHAPSREFVQRIACESGEYSLPSGATSLVRFMIQDEDNDCVICLEEFHFGDDAARLPCSHVCHFYCILEWFVLNGTCPVCRFACSRL